jgi:predicted transcriptional regulator
LFNKPFEYTNSILFAVLIVIETGSTPKYYEFFKRRNSMSIIAQILEETSIPVNKTQIIYKCNLSHSQMQVYLEAMLEMKLLTRKIDNDPNEKIVATSKGKNFTEQFHLLQAQIQ